MTTIKILTRLTAIALTVPAMADPVTPNISANANSANCTESVLETTSGTSNLEANWTANTLNLEWYSEGNKITPSNSTANTCNYDSGITVPENIGTKTGYTFAGWKVRAAAVVPSVPSCKDISDETTCDNTTGCAWSRPHGKCGRIFDNSVTYNNCAEITDPGECNSLFLCRHFDCYQLCVYNTKTNKCVSGIWTGTGSDYYDLPSSWCDELEAQNPYDCDGCSCAE